MPLTVTICLSWGPVEITSHMLLVCIEEQNMPLHRNTGQEKNPRHLFVTQKILYTRSTVRSHFLFSNSNRKKPFVSFSAGHFALSWEEAFGKKVCSLSHIPYAPTLNGIFYTTRYVSFQQSTGSHYWALVQTFDVKFTRATFLPNSVDTNSNETELH